MLRRVLTLSSSSTLFAVRAAAVVASGGSLRRFHSSRRRSGDGDGEAGDAPHRFPVASKRRAADTLLAELQQRHDSSTGPRSDFRDDEHAMVPATNKSAPAAAATQQAATPEQALDSFATSLEQDASPMSGVLSLSQRERDEVDSGSSSSAQNAFAVNADSRRRQRKQTMEQLEFPSGITERLDAHSGSRIQALYQLHYSDTVAREVFLAGGGAGQSSMRQPHMLEQMTPKQHEAARMFLESEERGEIGARPPSAGAAAAAAAASPWAPSPKHGTNEGAEGGGRNDLNERSRGVIFTLHLENAPTESFLHAIASRFGISRNLFVVHYAFSKEQCTTQEVFLCTSALGPLYEAHAEAMLLSINLMRFPGFGAKVSSVRGGITRAEFAARGRNTTFEVTTLLRRVQVDGGGLAVRAALRTMRRTGVINYFGTVGAAHLKAFRMLQAASFKAAVLSMLDHPNMRPELAAFLRDPSQQTAVAARRVTTNPVTAGMLRVFVETESFYRTFERAPASTRTQLLRTARRLAWNMMASRRVRVVPPSAARVAGAGVDSTAGAAQEEAELNAVADDEWMSRTVSNEILMKNLKPRKGDFVVIDSSGGADGAAASRWPLLPMSQVRLLESDEEAAKYTHFDIALPVLSHGSLDALPSAAARAALRAQLEGFDLLGLIETPAAFREQPAQWAMLTGAQDRGHPPQFRRLLLAVDNSIVADGDEQCNGGLLIAADPAPSGTIFDSRRILLNDRLLLQRRKRAEKHLAPAELPRFDAVALVGTRIPALDHERTLREVLRLPERSPFAGGADAEQLAWARNRGVGEFEPVHPIADTSRLTSAVSVAITFRDCDPAQVPVILREQFSLHGVLCAGDAQLQNAVHAQLRTCDMEAASVWAQSFCQICFSTRHSNSADCPLHQRRLANRMGVRQREKMEKETRRQRQQQQWTGRSEASGQKQHAAPAAESAAKQRSAPAKKVDDDDDDDNDMVVVSVARDAESKKWGILVSGALVLAPGTERLQPALAAFSRGTHRVQRVGASPVATVDQLKIALAAAGDGGTTSLTLVRV